MNLDNPRIEPYFCPAYYLSMEGELFRNRALAAMAAKKLTKAKLHRISGVPYHALDKFLKGASNSTSIDNALAIADALEISVDGDGEYNELNARWRKLSEDQKQNVLGILRAMNPQDSLEKEG